MNATASYGLLLKMKILRELGHELKPESVILDFGCGAGKAVGELRRIGYDAFGCDIAFQADQLAAAKSMHDDNLIRSIETRPYALPFDDNSFDFIFSDQVLEHVQNYPEAISEMSRVLRRDGCCLHVFPSRYRPIESHVYVPFASINRSYAWLLLWASLGIRNEFQHGMSAKETARRNYGYLRDHTTYLPKKQITQHFKRYFGDVDYCEDLLLKQSRKGRYVSALSRVFPFLPSIYSTFVDRVLVTRRPHKELQPEPVSA